MSHSNDEALLSEAQAYVLKGRDSGVVCPCCGLYVKEYWRTLNRPMVKFLRWLVAEAERQGEKDAWIYVNTGPLIQGRKGGGDFAKMAHWKLIEQKPNTDDRKRASGYWRPTELGVQFVGGFARVPKRIKLFNNELLEMSEETTDMEEALDRGFDYADLMEKERLK